MSSFSPIEGVRFHANNNRFIKEVCPFFGVGVCRLLGSGATRADNFAGSAPIWWSFDSGCTGRGKCFRPLDNPADPSCCKRPIDYGPQVLIAKIGEGLAKRIRGRLSRSFFALSVLSQEA